MFGGLRIGRVCSWERIQVYLVRVPGQAGARWVHLAGSARSRPSHSRPTRKTSTARAWWSIHPRARPRPGRRAGTGCPRAGTGPTRAPPVRAVPAEGRSSGTGHHGQAACRSRPPPRTSAPGGHPARAALDGGHEMLMSLDKPCCRSAPPCELNEVDVVVGVRGFD